MAKHIFCIKYLHKVSMTYNFEYEFSRCHLYKKANKVIFNM